jgi:hypothetical protein
MTVLGVAEPERLLSLGNGDGFGPLLAERGVTRVCDSAFEIERVLCDEAPVDSSASSATPVLNEATAAP